MATYLHHRRQTVMALAEIDRPGRHIDPQRSNRRDHRAARLEEAAALS